MLNIAIICEYNLFHNGHKRQIEHLHDEFSDAAVTALMSGNYVQRGETAICDKYFRAECAARCGADLVLEFPLPHSMGSAEYFARGAVELLSSLGTVDMLCFGSECGDIKLLKSIAENMLSHEFNTALQAEIKAHRSDSISFIRLRSSLYTKMYGELKLGSNDILGIEYVKSLLLSGSAIIPVTVKRCGNERASDSRGFIRTQDYESLEKIVPEELFPLYQACEMYDMKYIEKYILCYMRTVDSRKLKKYDGITDGMEFRISDAADKSVNLEQMYAFAATKKYTDSKIRRTVLNCIFGITEQMLKSSPQYTAVLAANENGRALLREMKKKSSVPIISKSAYASRMSGYTREIYELNRRADSVYALACERPKEGGFLLKRTPYIIL